MGDVIGSGGFFPLGGSPGFGGGAGEFSRGPRGRTTLIDAAEYAQRLGVSPGAPPNYGGRGVETGMRPVMAITLPRQTAQNDFTGFPSKGFKFNAPHPVIIQAQSRALNGSDPGGANNLIYAVPMDQRPVTVNSGFAGNGIGGEFVAIRSTNGGTLYLPPGDYWLFYPDTNDCPCGVFDARDPMFAAWMLSLPGNHVVSRHPSDFTLDDATPNLTLMTANRWRKWFTVQNTTLEAVGVNTNIRIGFNTPPTPTRGLQLGFGQSATFSGDLLLFQQCQAIREFGIGAGGPTLKVHIMEVM